MNYAFYLHHFNKDSTRPAWFQQCPKLTKGGTPGVLGHVGVHGLNRGYNASSRKRTENPANEFETSLPWLWGVGRCVHQ